MKKIGKYLLVFVTILLVLFGLLLITCSFPSSAIKNNIEDSLKTLKKEGNRKVCFIINKFQFQEFDNYSDSLMINTAYSIDNKNPLYSAFTAKKNYVPGITKKIFKDEIGELKSSSKNDIHDEVSDLENTLTGKCEESFEYAKYWHGYLIFLRPLLLIFDYQQIRLILTFILALLAIFIITSIAEDQSRTIASIFLITLVNVEYFYIGLSLLNSITFLIMMISSLILVKRFDKIKDFGLFFFIIGMCTSFFGLLDVPLLTYGVPLILYYIYKKEKGKGDFKELVKFSLLWLIGYSLMWISKWILMDIIYGRNLIKIGIGQVLYRSIGGKVTPIQSISYNMFMVIIPLILTLFIIFYFYIRYCKNMNKENLRKGIIFIIISLIPFIWYSMFSNHSLYHYFFFTYRLLFITLVAIPTGLYYICGEPEK